MSVPLESLVMGIGPGSCKLSPSTVHGAALRIRNTGIDVVRVYSISVVLNLLFLIVSHCSG